MRCTGCGKEIKDDAMFCPFCGTRQESAGTKAPAGAPEGDAGQEKGPEQEAGQTTGGEEKTPLTAGTAGSLRNRKGFIWAGAIIAVLIGLVLLVRGILAAAPARIDLEQYLTLSVSGYDGYASPTVALDDVRLYKDVAEAMEKKGVIGDTEDMYEALGRAYDIAAVTEAWRYEVSPKSGLSNGDEVVLDISYDNEALKDYKIAFSGSKITLKVDGLKEVSSFDPFENITLVFSGIQPGGKATVSPADDQYGIYYVVEPSTGLSNGDTVTVTATWEMGIKSEFGEDYVRRYGAVPSKTQETYTVSGLDAYLTSISEIPEEMLAKMQSICEDDIAALYAQTQDRNRNNKYGYQASYIGSYVLAAKPGSNTMYHNIIHLLYRIDETSDIVDSYYDSGETETVNLTYYRHFTFYDAVIMDDGTCSLDLSRCMTDSDFMYGNSFRYPLTNISLSRYGVKELDTFFNKYVTAERSNYTYESTVQP